MYLSIIILPLLGSLVSGFLGRKVGTTGSQIITCTSLLITSVLITIAFYEVGLCGSVVRIELGSWIDSELMNISWEFYFDQLTVSLGLAVVYCSTLIHIYSIDYLSTDPALCFGKTLKWVKLSNSGDILKLMIPNYIRKSISGWSNYSCKVTSHKMIENEMDYRGSKSNKFYKYPQLKAIKLFVKEQRVDGSYCIANSKLMQLRYTLMGFERNYPVKIPSKQIKIKKFSTFNNLSDININRSKAWFWTGLIDAEGSFSIIIDKTNKRKLGWRVQSKFQIGLHKRELPLILELQQFLGGIGSIQINSSRNVVNYSIDSNKDLINLINHFDNYYLLTQKAADFLLFKQVVLLMNSKAHLTNEGLHQIINNKASMNLGLSEFLKSEFKNFNPVPRAIINTKHIPDPNWIAGFVTGEGCFDINIPKSTNKIGYRVQLRFRITQHLRDLELMECLIKYLVSGQIYKYPNKQAVSLIVVKFSDIINTIIPFFEKNPLLGTKSLEYLDWCKVSKLMKDGSHLTIKGLNKIKDIKSRMNTGRKII